MEKEIYIFSNQPVAPVKEFREGITSDYIDLSTHLNPEVSVAPCYDTPIGYPVFQNTFNKDLDEHKEKHKGYDFVHVYKVVDSVVENDNETFIYKYSHKEFNIKGERKRA